jgi:hypothetical protein
VSIERKSVFDDDMDTAHHRTRANIRRANQARYLNK